LIKSWQTISSLYVDPASINIEYGISWTIRSADGAYALPLPIFATESSHQHGTNGIVLL
jgi:hypothetical protein